MSRKYLVLTGIVLALALICMYIVIEHHEPLDSAVGSGVHIYTDKESYVIGEIVTFGIANEGNETAEFFFEGTGKIMKKEKGGWRMIHADVQPQYAYESTWSLDPGKKTGDIDVEHDECRWDTGKHHDLTPGRYAIMWAGSVNETLYIFMKEFTLKNA